MTPEHIGIYSSIHPTKDKTPYYRKWDGKTWYSGSTGMGNAISRNIRETIGVSTIETEIRNGYVFEWYCSLDGDSTPPARVGAQLDLFS